MQTVQINLAHTTHPLPYRGSLCLGGLCRGVSIQAVSVRGVSVQGGLYPGASGADMIAAAEKSVPDRVPADKD